MDEITMLRGLLDSRSGTCPDCAEERLLVPVDDERLEWCCVECGAAFVTWQGWTASAGRTPSQVA